MEYSKNLIKGSLTKTTYRNVSRVRGNQLGMARLTGKKPSPLLDLKGQEEGAVAHTQ